MSNPPQFNQNPNYVAPQTNQPNPVLYPELNPPNLNNQQPQQQQPQYQPSYPPQPQQNVPPQQPQQQHVVTNQVQYQHQPGALDSATNDLNKAWMSFEKSLNGTPSKTTTTTTTISLPPGWEMRYEPSGRPYFIDHNKKMTTYQDPRIPMVPQPQIQVQPQPVQQQTVVYDNRSVLDPSYWFGGPSQTTTTTVTSAPKPQVVLSGPPLPTGWEARADQTGKVYFIDHKTKTTTYTDPRVGKK